MVPDGPEPQLLEWGPHPESTSVHAGGKHAIRHHGGWMYGRRVWGLGRRREQPAYLPRGNCFHGGNLRFLGMPPPPRGMSETAGAWKHAATLPVKSARLARHRRFLSSKRFRRCRRSKSPQSRSRSLRSLRSFKRRHSPRSRSRSALPCSREVSQKRSRSTTASSPRSSGRDGACSRRRASQWCEECKCHLGWVELRAPCTAGPAPSSRCSRCERQLRLPAQETGAGCVASTTQVTDGQAGHADAGELEQEETGLEVDEFGFSMALDQIREASCPEDGAAVLEVLLRSRPTRELLETNTWVHTLRSHLEDPASQLGVLARKLFDHWDHLRSHGGPSAGVPAERPTTASALGKALESAAPTSTAQHNPREPAGGESRSAGDLTKSKGFLGPLLERARRRATQRPEPAKAKAEALGTADPARPAAQLETGSPLGGSEPLVSSTGGGLSTVECRLCQAASAGSPAVIPRRPPCQPQLQLGLAERPCLSSSWPRRAPSWCPPPRSFLPSPVLPLERPAALQLPLGCDRGPGGPWPRPLPVPWGVSQPLLPAPAWEVAGHCDMSGQRSRNGCPW